MTSIYYASKTINGVIATQITAPLETAACVYSNPTECASHTVWIIGKAAFESSGGPHAYTVYCLITVFCSIGCGLIFVPMMYKDAKSYRETRKVLDMDVGSSLDLLRGIVMVFLFVLALAVSYMLSLVQLHVFHVRRLSF
jgi:hypothetical protein